MIGHHDGTILFRLFGAGTEMRDRHNLVVAHQFLDRKVCQVLANPTSLQTLENRLCVSDFFPRQVDQSGSLLEAIDQFFVDQVTGRFKDRQVQSHDVRLGEQRLHILHLLDITREAPGGGYGKSRIITQHFHTEHQTGFCNQGTDGAEANNTKGLALQLCTTIGLLTAFNQLVQFLCVLALTFFTDKLDGTDNIAG